MPELPEVESVRRGLQRARLRAAVRSIYRSRERLRIGTAWNHENLEVLLGAHPGKVARRGKYILWHFTGASHELGLIVHLGMSGRFGLARAADPRLAHTHFVLQLEDGREVRLVDPRRFGGLRAGVRAELEHSAPLCELGPEPLDRGFNGGVLAERAAKSARALRDVLLDQHVIAGVGNIYAVEALYRAGIHPLVAARRLRESAWDRLATALRDVLRAAIDNGGTTLRDFRDVRGHVGRNQNELAVYGRAGQPCPGCGTALVGFVHGGRSGVRCPVDQPRRRGAIV